MGLDSGTNSLFLIQKKKRSASQTEGVAQYHSLNLWQSLKLNSVFFKYFPLNHPSVSMSGMLQKHTMKMEKSKKLYPLTFRIHLKNCFPFFTLIHDFV